jgi:hypothetical protein
MKTLVAALAGAALITAPMTVQAQSHGGGHGGGGHGFGGGFHGGGFHGGGFHGGFRGGGFHRGFGFYGAPFFYGAGLGLGLAYYDPWFWGYPGYGYYGYPAYYDYDYDYGDDYAPPPGGYSGGYYRGTMPEDDAATGPNAGPAGSEAAPPAARACGTWRWDSTAQKYQWDTTGC